jgi:murein DD-endopeptidase MepM/ murein hydrolase activator NlpD
MRPPLKLLVVHGDGSQVFRFRLPHWIVYSVIGLGAATLGTVVGLSHEYTRLQRQRGDEHARVQRERGELISLRQQVGTQREVIDAFETRLATVRKDIASWTSLHADMWEALGPKGGASEQPTGIGGVPGASATVPPGDTAPRPLDELDSLASSVAEESPRLRKLAELIGRMGKFMNALPLRWPVHGPVNSEYGRRRSPWDGRLEQHPGIDIGAALGTPVESPAPGTVIVASSGGGYGRHVKLDHGNGVRSLYGHLSRLDVKAGQRVKKGQVIGLVGSTGRSTGPHLHYEVRVEGKRVDPRSFLWER